MCDECQKFIAACTRKRKKKWDYELIKRLRERTNLSDKIASDEEILNASKDTFLRAVIELKMAWENVFRIMKDR